jgi:hypothetical protein
MPFIVLIPGILCMAAILREGTRQAFLTLYLPVLLFIPTGFYLAIQHLPSLSFVDTTLLSLAIGMILRDTHRWRFSLMDVWVILFLFSASYSSKIPWGPYRAILIGITLAMECFVPYMVGKLLLEQSGMRAEAVRRLVTLLAIASLIAMPEAILKANPYVHFWSHFFPGQWPDHLQARHGLGRVGGAYGGAETNGMVLMICLPLALWLQRPSHLRPETTESYVRPLSHSTIIISILIATLAMTQSRGPWIGAVIALAIASTGRAKRPLRRAVLVFGLGLLVGVPLYILGKDYINPDLTEQAQVGSEVQTAQYREQMIDNYVPIAELGGAWGWGDVYPVIQGQFSIDNEYLLVWLTQGYIGLTALLLILVSFAVSMTRAAMKPHSSQERYFVLTLLGSMVGIAICIFTVWLPAQPFQLFFLILGWSQAIRPADAGEQQLRYKSAHDDLPQAVTVRVFT